MLRHSPFKAGSSKWRTSRTKTSPDLPLGELLERVHLDNLEAPEGLLKAEITNEELVSSYNWIAGSSPKIMIPGKPPRWTPLSGSKTLRPDSGDYFRDVSAASYPLHPMEPTVISIMKTAPAPLPINIVACGSTMANLLRFSGASKLDRTFRILVEVVGDTVHFVRRENSPRELIAGVKGYGHTFPEAFTTWDEAAKGSTSHQRVIRYEFGGLRMMVRFGGDGFIETSGGSRRQSSVSPSSASSLSSVDEALESFSTLKVSGKTPGSNDTADLEVVEGGTNVPLEAIFDLKTRSAYYNTDPNETLRQQIHRFWVTQIKQLILAYHHQGKFTSEDIKIMQIEDDVKQWENDRQPELMRLVALLHLIVDRAKKAPDGRLEIVCSPDEPLEIRKQVPGSGDVLSESVREDWLEWLGKTQSHSDEDERLSFSVPSYNQEDTDSDRETDSNGEAADYAACDQECGYCGKCMY